HSKTSSAVVADSTSDQLRVWRVRSAPNPSTRLVAEIFEVGRDFEIFSADKLDDALQFVLFFPSHPNLPVLQRTLHLEAGFFDRLDYLFRLFAFQALLNLQFLPRVTQG